jgi:hypothetical protein
MLDRSFKLAPPQQVYDSYKAIRTSNLITHKSIDDKNIAEFQNHLNSSQPKTDDENMTRSLIQYLYRKNPTNFCRFLVRSRLSHLILWTESKCIVRHFGLQGIVYVKWNDQDYECSLHRNVKINTLGEIEHPEIVRIYEDRPDRFSNDRQDRPDRFSNDRQDRPDRFSNDRQDRPDRFSNDRHGRPDRYSNNNRRNRQDRYRSERRSDRYTSDVRSYPSHQTVYNNSHGQNFPVLNGELIQTTPPQNKQTSDGYSDDPHDSDVDEVVSKLANSLILPTDEAVSYINALKSSDVPPVSEVTV